jgi:CheY-like chemotaxis protein
VGHADELSRESHEVALAQREAEDETVAAVPGAEWQPRLDHVELAREVFERTVVRRDAADAQRRNARFGAELGHDLARRPHSAGRFHGLKAYGTPLACTVSMRIDHRPRPVLIVDDDIETLLAERELLVESGFRVVEARDGAEALRVVQLDPPALVVLDVQMPGMDGPSFARELRMALRRVPLVILTGVADPRREADRCNAEAYLAKPYDARELVDIVRRFAA